MLAEGDYTETIINLAVSQRFLQGSFSGWAIGYTNTSYFNAVEGITALRNDDFYYLSPSIDLMSPRYWTVGAYYVHRVSTAANIPFFSLPTTRSGFRTKLTFSQAWDTV